MEGRSSYFGADETMWWISQYAFTEDIETINSRLENELADVMAQLIRIAYIYNIDLEKAFIDARKEEDLYLKFRNV